MMVYSKMIPPKIKAENGMAITANSGVKTNAATIGENMAQTKTEKAKAHQVINRKSFSYAGIKSAPWWFFQQCMSRIFPTLHIQIAKRDIRKEYNGYFREHYQ